jgi:hypothetical protein
VRGVRLGVSRDLFPGGTAERRVMKTNEILEDIYRVREEHARECNYDVKTMFARMKEHLKELEAQGWRVVSPEPRKTESACSLREEPPKQKQQP